MLAKGEGNVTCRYSGNLKGTGGLFRTARTFSCVSDTAQVSGEKLSVLDKEVEGALAASFSVQKLEASPKAQRGSCLQHLLDGVSSAIVSPGGIHPCSKYLH